MSWMALSDQMASILWDATWQSACLACLVFVIVGLLGRWIAPSWRAILFAIPLCRLVVLVVPVTSFSLFGWVTGPVFDLPREAQVQPAWIATAETIAEPFSTIGHPLHTSDRHRELVMRPHTAAVTTNESRVVPIMILIWLSGASLLLAKWIRSSWIAHRLIAQSDVADASLQGLIDEYTTRARLVRRVIGVVPDEEVGPATCGLLQPRILVAKPLLHELAEDDLRIIIAHELEHIRRLDCMMLWLGRLAITLHWFNPLAYVLRRALAREIELAVDASTLGQLGASRATAYSELLVRIASRAHAHLGLAQMAGRSNLRRRVERLIAWRQPKGWHAALGAVIAFSLVLVGLSDTERRSVAAQESTPQDSTANETTPPGATSASGLVNEHSLQEQSPGESTNGDPPATNAKTAEVAERSALTQQEKSAPLRASGRVIDASGNPVAGAKLFCDAYLDDNSNQSLSATSNENGEFSIDYPRNRNSYELFHTWTYAKGHGVRVVMMVRKFLGDDGATDVEIKLPPQESIELRILAPDSAPVADAIVRPWYVEIPNGTFAADEGTGLSGFVPDGLKPLLTWRTDSEGRVTVESIPLELLRSLEIETPNYGRQQFRRFRNFSHTIRLLPVGKIRGTLIADSPERFAGQTVYIETSRRTVQSGSETQLRITPNSVQSGWEVEGLGQAVLDEHGNFFIPAITEGLVLLSMTWDTDLEVLPVLQGPSNLVVQADQELRIVMEAERTILVKGAILTSDTREPVVGAEISGRSPPRVPRIPIRATTDANGRYSIRLPAGNSTLQVISLGSTRIAANYDTPGKTNLQIEANQSEFEAAEILIQPRHLVKGRVLDRDGKPVANQEVVLHSGVYRHLRGQSQTNQDGTFEMRVRRWETSESRRNKRYWAILETPAVNTDPPVFTRLDVIQDDPDLLVLQQP